MFKLLSTLILLMPSLISIGQEQIINYKKVSDKLIRQHFDSSLWKKIECKQAWIEDVDKSTGYGTAGSFNYDEIKLEKRKFSSITFTYTFYSPKVNNPFSFDIALNARKKAIYKNHVFENVPSCIRLNRTCDFITKDSAIIIAKNDSILHPENLVISLQQAPKTKQFYWVVEGQLKPNPISKNNSFSSGYGSPRKYKYVNAHTGELISRQHFFQGL